MGVGAGLGGHVDLPSEDERARQRVGAMAAFEIHDITGRDDDHATIAGGLALYYGHDVKDFDDTQRLSLVAQAFAGVADQFPDDSDSTHVPRWLLSGFLGMGYTDKQHRFGTIALGFAVTRIDLQGEQPVWLIGVALQAALGFDERSFGGLR
jgi:hypothetical protein